MNAGTAKPGGDSPAEVYSLRLQELNQTQTTEMQREKLFAFTKLALAALTVLSGIFLLRYYTSAIEFLLAPVGVFIALAVAHEKLIRSIRLRARAIEFYERGLARIQNRWAGSGETGERFLSPSHPYARDLDLFGKASLFELLCTARTRAGEETLAAWLLAAAPVEEVLLRQGAVEELKDRVNYREKLFLLGETVRLGVHPEKLADWGKRRPLFPAKSTRIVTLLLAILWLGSLVSWGVWGMSLAAGIMTVVNLYWAHRLHNRLDEAASFIENAAKDLELLAGVLSHLESEAFSSPKLVEMQAALQRDGWKPSIAIRKLSRLVEYLNQRHNFICRVPDLFIFWSAHLVFAAELWQQKFGPEIRGWLATVGEMEALTALSAYGYEHPEDVFPEFAEAKSAENSPLLDAQGLAHPLLPATQAIRNDVKLGDGLQLIVLSGPNMAGKSTFIRSIGVNAVLAQCGAPVRAKRLRLSPLAVAASICVLDSLSGGISRFYAEIHRVKLVFDLAQGPLPVLFLLDELLSGTNSHDRLAGTQFVVQSLTERNAIGIVSTHDLALTQIPETMGTRASNFHFEDRLEEERLIFDYTLKPGVVKTSNALELMRSIGLSINADRAL
jgi:hypothetical protein